MFFRFGFFWKSAEINATASKIMIELLIMTQNDHTDKPVKLYFKNDPFCLFLRAKLRKTACIGYFYVS